MSLRSFLDRFVHPWVAAVAPCGVLLWLVSFLVAAIGVVLRSAGSRPLLVIDLFFGSGLLGVGGIAVLAACGCYLVGVRTRQVIAAQ